MFIEHAMSGWGLMRTEKTNPLTIYLFFLNPFLATFCNTIISMKNKTLLFLFFKNSFEWQSCIVSSLCIVCSCF